MATSNVIKGQGLCKRPRSCSKKDCKWQSSRPRRLTTVPLDCIDFTGESREALCFRKPLLHSDCGRMLAFSFFSCAAHQFQPVVSALGSSKPKTDGIVLLFHPKLSQHCLRISAGKHSHSTRKYHSQHPHSVNYFRFFFCIPQKT